MFASVVKLHLQVGHSWVRAGWKSQVKYYPTPPFFKFQTNYITLRKSPNGLNSRRTVGASGPSKDERVLFVADWPGKERTLKIAIQNDGWLSKEKEQKEIDFAILRNLIAAFNRQRWESSTSLSSVASSRSSSCDAEWVPLASAEMFEDCLSQNMFCLFCWKHGSF